MPKEEIRNICLLILYIAIIGSLSLLQQIFLTQELNRGLLHCRQILYHQLFKPTNIFIQSKILLWDWFLSIFQCYHKICTEQHFCTQIL